MDRNNHKTGGKGAVTGTPSQLSHSRIPRPLTSQGVSRTSQRTLKPKSETFDYSKMNSISIELRFKNQLSKFNQEVSQANAVRNRLDTYLSNLTKLRDDLMQKAHKDPGPLPEIPSWMNNNEQEKILTTKNDQLLEENAALKQKIEQLNEKCEKRKAYISLVQSEMPKISENYSKMLEVMKIAEVKQKSLDVKLENFKTDVKHLINDFQNMSNLQAKREALNEELEKIQNEAKLEKLQFSKELEKKDQSLKLLKEEYEAEKLMRKTFEENLKNLNEEKKHLQVNCQKFIEQIDNLKQLNIISCEQETSTSINPNEQQRQLVSSLQRAESAVEEAQNQLVHVSTENTFLKKQITELKEEKSVIQLDVTAICQEAIFGKENQIFKLKAKMEELVTLKNAIQTENDGYKNYDLDCILLLDDTRSLKTEVVHFHKKWIAAVEEKEKLIKRLKESETQIRKLEESREAEECVGQDLDRLVQTLKEKVQSNTEVIRNLHSSLMEKERQIAQMSETIDPCNTSFQFPSTEKFDFNSSEESMQVALRSVEMYKSALSQMEKKLNDLQDAHHDCNERRTRNEQRIALLEINLAKYE